MIGNKGSDQWQSKQAIQIEVKNSKTPDNQVGNSEPHPQPQKTKQKQKHSILATHSRLAHTRLAHTRAPRRWGEDRRRCRDHLQSQVQPPHRSLCCSPALHGDGTSSRNGHVSKSSRHGTSVSSQGSTVRTCDVRDALSPVLDTVGAVVDRSLADCNDASGGRYHEAALRASRSSNIRC
jgi:hypothetical protein